MIEVIYRDRLGNNLFQYCLGRILATELHYKLKAAPISGFPATFEQINGTDYSGTVDPLIYTEHDIDLNYILKNKPQKKIILDGWFQKYSYYQKYRDQIRTDWLRLEVPTKITVSKQDLIVAIRRGDYVPRNALPLSYYEDAIKRMNYEKLYICTDSPNDPFVKYFIKKYAAKIVHSTTLEDLAFIKQFNNIIISNSSYYWWAAFLSDAEQIISPIPLNGFWSGQETIGKGVELTVPEARYTYLKCREPYRPQFFKEYSISRLKYLRFKSLNLLPAPIKPILRKLLK